jgi:hypothetical protein
MINVSRRGSGDTSSVTFVLGLSTSESIHFISASSVSLDTKQPRQQSQRSSIYDAHQTDEGVAFDANELNYLS